MLSSYLEINFEDIREADNSRYANGNGIQLVIIGPIALFSKFKLTTSSEKHLEDISQAHVSLMYILLTVAKNSENLSIRFH